MTADRVDAAEVLGYEIGWGAAVDALAALMAYGNGGPVVLLPDGSVKGLEHMGGSSPLYALTDPTPPSEQGGE